MEPRWRFNRIPKHLRSTTQRCFFHSSSLQRVICLHPTRTAAYTQYVWLHISTVDSCECMKKEWDRGVPPLSWTDGCHASTQTRKACRVAVQDAFLFCLFFFFGTPESYPLKAMRRGLPQLESCRSSFIVVERHRPALFTVHPESVSFFWCPPHKQTK